MKWNWRPLSLKSCHFEARKDIMTKFKSQALQIIRIKYWKASGSGNSPSFISALWNIGILLHKQATHTKHSWGECIHELDYNLGKINEALIINSISKENWYFLFLKNPNFDKLSLNPVSTRLCHVIFYPGDRKYPYLVAIGLSPYLQWTPWFSFY